MADTPSIIVIALNGYLELNVDPIHWATVNAVQQLAAENDRLKSDSVILKAESAQLKARADKAEAESVQLKAFLCVQFPSAPMCKP